MYEIPSELLQPGRPYPAFLRHLAEHGYYGEGDVHALVARRVQVCATRQGRASRINTPDGRWFRIFNHLLGKSQR